MTRPLTLAQQTRAKIQKLQEEKKAADKEVADRDKEWLDRLMGQIPDEMKFLIAEKLSVLTANAKDCRLEINTENSRSRIHAAKVEFVMKYLKKEGFIHKLTEIATYPGSNDPEWPTEPSMSTFITFTW